MLALVPVGVGVLALVLSAWAFFDGRARTSRQERLAEEARETERRNRETVKSLEERDQQWRELKETVDYQGKQIDRQRREIDDCHGREAKMRVELDELKRGMGGTA